MKQYGTIIVDCPWQYRNKGGNGAAANHYPTMSQAQLLALPVATLAAPDAVLLMWATWTHMEEALALINGWGFTYITGMPWVKLAEPPKTSLYGDFEAKPTYGTGMWVRGCSEPILIARRGKVKPPDCHYLGLLGERLQHSRKPESLHEYGECCPGPRLEMFARRMDRAGWDYWGNEIEGVEIEDRPIAAKGENGF
jgi:N6-adenosine-specific RNA methylase IME4